MNWLARRRAGDGGFRARTERRSQGGRHDTDDVNWAILSYGDGSVVSLGVSYAAAGKIPGAGTRGAGEVLGTEGVMILDDDHTDQLMYSEKGVPHVYLPGHSVNMVFPAERHTGRLGARRILGTDRQTKRAPGSTTSRSANHARLRRRARRAAR